MSSAADESRLKIEALGAHHDRVGFSCGVDALDDYLSRRAGQDARKRIAAPFVLTADGGRQVLGYYTLSAISVVLGDLPQQVSRKLPRYPVVPATLLGRLAVDVRHRGQGLGRHLLMDALFRSLRTSAEVASFALVVDAINQEAERFYAGYEFQRFPGQPGRLFLSMKKVAEIFPDK